MNIYQIKSIAHKSQNTACIDYKTVDIQTLRFV